MRRLFGSRVDHHITRLGILLLAAALVMGVMNCAPIQHTLSVRSTPGGSVAVPGEGDYFYGPGEVVELVAEADEGYRFVNWTGDVDTIVDVNAASTTITMNGDYEIIANFEEIYELTVSSSEGGSVTTPGEGTFTYEAGVVVSLVASPASGHRFVNWTGDVDTIADVEGASTTITLNGDYSITANFVARYVLTIGSTEGGEVTAPGEGTFTYDAGTAVELEAEADEGYTFMEWTGDVDSVTDVTAASTTVTIEGGYAITASFAKGIWDWYDLDAIREDLSGSYALRNDLDITTAGYQEVAGPDANDGNGWEPVGSEGDPFVGTFDGQGYEISDLVVDRHGQDHVGFFGQLLEGAVVEDVSLISVDVTGGWFVGGLVGVIHDSIVSNSYATGSVRGDYWVGGLVGRNFLSATLSDSYFTGSVAGDGTVGGLVGGHSWGTVRNSYYNYDEVLINGQNVISTGALYGEDFEKWLANDKFLDVNEKLVQEDGYYVIDTVSHFKELLAFGQDDSLRFSLTSDLDLANEPNFYIPYLAGEFRGDGHRISNLSFDFDFVRNVGLFGVVGVGGKVSELAVENTSITGDGAVGALVGWADGTVSNSYSTGSVTGGDNVGGLRWTPKTGQVVKVGFCPLR